LRARGPVPDLTTTMPSSVTARQAENCAKGDWLARTLFAPGWFGDDDEVARVPRERRFLTPIGAAAIRNHLAWRRAPVGLSAVPHHFDWQIAGLFFQLVKSPQRATAHDERNRFFASGHE